MIMRKLQGERHIDFYKCSQNIEKSVMPEALAGVINIFLFTGPL